MLNERLINYLYVMLAGSILLTSILFVFTLNLYGYLTIQTINIEGNYRVSQTEIMKRTNLEKGQSSLLFLDSDLEAKIEKSPWVLDAAVTKILPNSVSIRIKEAEIFCLIDSGNKNLKYISDSGIILDNANIEFGLDFPVIIGESIIEPGLLEYALSILKISRYDPVLNFEHISELNVNSVYGITVVTTEGVNIFFGFGENLEERWNTLKKTFLFSQNSNIKQQFIDLSLKDKVVVKYDL
ncbi:MAG: FtsQ-type POTRA domain-containing protein [Candidatus Dadabacteria bacterium]|nr:FtsQ-type POTRA domain-containing protein [Candidatus Dadabacteria bacterium]NIV41685.1 FtsQ-type POTRA domain-containing protein [Candidatus Dadabacteria bacterium]NIX16304.1 FtsQ-type POTRA domain-containing protein [Candidatus Dadabacteria bacterium]